MGNKMDHLPHHDIDKAREDKESSFVEMCNIVKSFGEVQAVNDVSFSIGKGEIRALVGENGAGKTTLMNILYGLCTPDSGHIFVKGNKVTKRWSPQEAILSGIGMIHQHFSLIPNHTVFENLCTPLLRWKDINPPWRKLEADIIAMCNKYHFRINLSEFVRDLSMGERQQVEVLKALSQGAELLILDEPTSVLTPQQKEALFKFLKELKKQQHAVIIVTHKLDEATQVSDKITVMRDGKEVGTVKTSDANPQIIARMMVERDWINPPVVAHTKKDAPLLLDVQDISVKGLSGEIPANKITFSIKAGEIVGIAGVAGNGQVELAETLIGLRQISSGVINLEGEEISRWSVSNRRNKGLAYIPEDRHNRGVILELSVLENIILDCVEREPFSKKGILQPDIIREKSEEVVAKYKIKTPNIFTPVKQLSGGNQQKVVLARSLLMNTKVLIACEPTRGLDFGAMEYVREKLVEAVKNDIGILLISSDLDEVLDLSHRVLVMYEGQLIGHFDRDEVNIEEIGLLMAGHEIS